VLAGERAVSILGDRVLEQPEAEVLRTVDGVPVGAEVQDLVRVHR
jgi:hypothetical protein